MDSFLFLFLFLQCMKTLSLNQGLQLRRKRKQVQASRYFMYHMNSCTLVCFISSCRWWWLRFNIIVKNSTLEMLMIIFRATIFIIYLVSCHCENSKQTWMLLYQDDLKITCKLAIIIVTVCGIRIAHSDTDNASRSSFTISLTKRSQASNSVIDLHTYLSSSQLINFKWKIQRRKKLQTKTYWQTFFFSGGNQPFTVNCQLLLWSLWHYYFSRHCFVYISNQNV